MILFWFSSNYYKCHKSNSKCGGSNICSPDGIRKEKSNNKSKSMNDKCFQYAATIALNYEEIKCNPEGVSNIKPFIKKYS